MTEYKSNKKAVQEAMTRAARLTLEGIGVFVEGEAISRAPVDTGNLRGSITHRVEDKSVVIGTPVEYAPYVELGTSRSTAQPYLEPSVVDNAGRIEKLARDLFKLKE